jgi:hypothetical protein
MNLLTNEKETVFLFAKHFTSKGLHDKAIVCYEKILFDDNPSDGDKTNLIKTNPCPDFRVYFNYAQLLSARLAETRDTVTTSSCLSLLVECLFLKVIEIKPTIIEPYANLAAIYIKQSENSKSLRIGLVGIEKLRSSGKPFDENSILLFTNINIALRRLGKIKEAIYFTWAEFLYSVQNKSSTCVEAPSQRLFAFDERTMDFACLEEREVETLIRQSIWDKLRSKLLDAIESPSQSNFYVETDRITVRTVVMVKHGAKYAAAYVNRLVGMIEKHVKPSDTIKYRFICYTDDPLGLSPQIIPELLPSEQSNTLSSTSPRLAKWWNKIHIFSKELNEKHFHSSSSYMSPNWLYIDLDSIILGDIGDLWDEVHHNSQPVDAPGCIYFLDSEHLRNEGNYLVPILPARADYTPSI